MKRINYFRVVGVALMIFALLANPFVLEQLFSPDKKLDFLWNYFAIAGFDIVLFLFGLFLYSEEGRIILFLKAKKKEILFLFIIALIFLLVIGIIGEIYFRDKYNKEHEQLVKKYAGEARDICSIKSNDASLIYGFAPNKCGANSRGFLDYEHNYTKGKGVFRVVIIGDSIAMGFGVNPFNESFGKVLEKKLNNNSNSLKFEIIILAVPGYSTSQELVLLKNEAFRYNPDLILWSYCLNDPENPLYRNNSNEEAGVYFFKPKSFFLHFMASKIFLIKEKIAANIKNCSEEFHSFLNCVYWEDIKNNLKEIGRISKEKQVPVIFLINSVFEENKSFENYSWKGINENLSNEANKDGLITYDLLMDYKGYNPNDLATITDGKFDGWHPNAKGHELIADYIYKNLIRSG